MPNYCENTVIFTHDDAAQIARIKSTVEQDKPLFAEFVPRPESEEENWYDWNIKNWGTKWDAGDTDITGDYPNCNCIALRFSTAWAPPIGFYQQMESLGFEVIAYYYEQGMAFCGKYVDGIDEDYETSDINSIPQDIVEEFGLDEIEEY